MRDRLYGQWLNVPKGTDFFLPGAAAAAVPPVPAGAGASPMDLLAVATSAPMQSDQT